MERYSKQEKAGQGTYGVVYKSWDNEAKGFVALKVQGAVGVRKLFLQTATLEEMESMQDTTRTIDDVKHYALRDTSIGVVDAVDISNERAHPPQM